MEHPEEQRKISKEEFVTREIERVVESVRHQEGRELSPEELRLLKEQIEKSWKDE